MATDNNWRSQNTVWLQVQKWTTKSRRKEICTWYYVFVVKPSTTPMTTWPPRPRTPSTQRTWTLTRECAVLLFVRQVRVVMVHIAPHGSRVLRMSSHPCMKCAVLLRPWVLHSFPLPHLPIHPSFISCTSSCTSSTTLRAVASLCTPPKRVWTILTTPTSSQVYEPNAYDLKETYVESYTESLTSPSPSTPQFSKQEFLEDVEYDDTALEDMLREAHRVHVYHSQREGLSVGQSSSSVSERKGRSVGERGPIGQELNVANAQIRTLSDRQKEQILAECQAEVTKNEFQADYDRRSVRKLGEFIESQQEELHCAQSEELQRRDQQVLHERLLQQNSELREAHQKSLNEMEELKKFQSSTFDTIARRRLVEDQDSILELTGKIQELQNEINCMNDSIDFQDAESIRSGNSHVTSRPVSFPTHPIPEGMLSRSIGMPSRREGPPSIWDTHGISGNVFVNPDASSSALYPQELNPWSSSTEEPLHSSTVL